MKKVAFAVLTLAIVVGVFALNFSLVTGQQRESQEMLPQEKFRTVSKPIPNRYIVVLEDWTVRGVSEKQVVIESLAQELSLGYRGIADKIYTNALNGFSVEMDEVQAELLSKDARVKYVEQDGIVYANATQTGATFGLDRIDQRDRPLDGNYNYTPTGSGVNAYIIDTGIRRTHSDFGGRAFAGYDAINDGQNTNDCNGHGTHVAGTVGGATWGVAKNARLYAVRVLGCNGSGTNSGVVAGIDWVAGNHVKPAVANMSLGGGASTATDNAVQNAINAGVTMVVAAGNENQNACNVSPARAANAVTVGSTTSTDARSSFSNFGTCVDIFAPGSSITSTWSTSDTATNTISGTSMASPHVAGVAALFLQNNTGASPAAVRAAIVNSASTNKLSGIGTGSPNLLLYSLLSGGGTNPTPTPTPTPNPTPTPGTCSGGTFTGTLSGTGANAYQPNGSYYYSAASGTHGGNLTGPGGADFDLFLQKWNGSAWATVGRSESATSTESVTYNGTAGYYRWRIYSYSGSGGYSLCTRRP